MAAFGITEGYSEEEDWTRFETAMEAMDDAMEGADSEAYEAAEAEAKEAAEVIKGKWIEGKKKMMNANDDSKEDQELNKVCDPNPKKPKDTMADFMAPGDCYECHCNNMEWKDGICVDDNSNDSSACRLSEFFVGGMEKYNELSCDDYMLEGDDKFTEPVSRA